MPRPLLACALLVALALVSTPHAHAQSLTERARENVRLSGGMSLQAESYATRGIAARRDPLSAQGALNFSARVGRLISYGANLTFSTQSVALSQQANSGVLNSLNRGSFDFGIGWAQFSAGNIAPRLTKYTLQDVAVFGGFVEMTPGPLVMTATAGRAREANVPLSDLERLFPSYERWLYGGRVGVGKKQGTHFHLIGLFGEDNTASAQRTDGLQPSQNLNLGTDFGFALFDRVLTVQAEGAVSLFTRDTEDDTFSLEDAGAPPLIDNLLTVNASTKASYAGQVEANVRTRMLQLGGGYERVQTGFESMGLTRANDDLERFKGQVRARLFDRKLQLTGRFNQSRNNLLDLLDATSTRRRYNGTAQAQLSSALATSLSYSASQSQVTTVDARRTRDLTTHSLSLTPTLTFTRGEVRHRTSLRAAHGWRSGTSTGPGAQAFTTTSAALSYGVVFPNRLSLNTSTTAQLADIAGFANSAFQVSVSGSQPLLRDALTLNLSTAYTYTANERPSGEAKQTVHRQTVQARAQWKVPFGGDVGVGIQGLNVAVSGAASYQELRTTLSYRRRF